MQRHRDQVVSSSGAVITYQVGGSGPSLVVVPGGTRAGHHYLRQGIDILHAAVPRSRVTMLSRAGHNAPDQDDPTRVAEQLKTFFSGTG